MSINIKGSNLGGVRISGSGGGVAVKTSAPLLTFTLSPSDSSNGFGGLRITALGASGNEGFVNGGGSNVINNCYFFGSLTPGKRGELDALWAAHGLSPDATGYIFHVTWGPGSSPSTGLARLGWYSAGDQVNVSAADPADPRTLGGSGSADSLPGTFTLPATFTIYVPTVSDGPSWC